MKRRALIAGILLALILAASVCADFIPALSYARQDRDFTSAGPGWRHPLGTDDLGRDRLARLLHATRISLLMAGAAAAATVLLAFLVGGAAGYLGGWCDAAIVRAIDLMLSMPWLFLLLAVRALLPLNISPIGSLLVTYGMLAALGWAPPARVIRAGVRSVRDSEFVLRAHAEGAAPQRVVMRHILPNLKPVLVAQFWTAVPVFILEEANLGFLGLSAGEPYPTWGNLLRDLESPLLLGPAAFAPIAAIALSILCFKMIAPWRSSQV